MHANPQRDLAHTELLILYAEGLLLQQQHLLYESKNDAVERMIERGVALLHECVHSPVGLAETNKRRIDALITEIDEFTAAGGNVHTDA